MNSGESVTATFTAAVSSSAAPGSYTGSSSQSGLVTFDVSPDSSHVQDVVVGTGMTCSPSFNFGGSQVMFASIPIGSDGSFSGTSTVDGVVANVPAQYTYTLSGQFAGTKAAGQVREDVAFNNGTAFSCTSNLVTWSVTRDAQGSDQSAASPPSGSYSGSSSQSGLVTFYVSPDSTHVQDLVVGTGMTCSPSFNFGGSQVMFASIPIEADGSISATTTVDGVVDNVPAQFTYTVAGHFHGTSTNGTERSAGQVREDVTFTNGSTESCTSNLANWSVTRQAQGSDQSASSPPAGSYSGSSSQSGLVTFDVSPDSTHIQDVVVGTGMTCSPSFNFGGSQVMLASIPIEADGSFSASTTVDGVADNVPAQFTYTVAGHFHGTNTTGTERSAGQVREDVTFNNGTAVSCTSNLANWSVTREAQGSDQSASTPPAGSYSGSSSQSGLVTFYVSPDNSHIQDVVVGTGITCSPSFNFGGTQVAFASIPIQSDGSFSAQATIDGVADNVPAQFTYTFAGHFHGTNTSGTERSAGQVREDVTFTNGATESCTSNLANWSVTRQAQGSNQSASSPTPGSYSGSSSQSGLVTFAVSSDATQLQNVTVGTGLTCSPTFNFGGSQVTFASIPIGTDGSFSDQTTVAGTVDNVPAQFTYTFAGHFHGTNTSGDERSAGQVREDVTFNNGTAHTCTSDLVTWSATGP
jgi:hypothetical protein